MSKTQSLASLYCDSTNVACSAAHHAESTMRRAMLSASAATSPTLPMRAIRATQAATWTAVNPIRATLEAARDALSITACTNASVTPVTIEWTCDDQHVVRLTVGVVEAYTNTAAWCFRHRVTWVSYQARTQSARLGASSLCNWIRVAHGAVFTQSTHYTMNHTGPGHQQGKAGTGRHAAS